MALRRALNLILCLRDDLGAVPQVVAAQGGDRQQAPPYVQKQLGHSSISITVDIYGHWIPGEGKKDLMSTLGGGRPTQARLYSWLAAKDGIVTGDKLSPVAPVGGAWGGGLSGGCPGDKKPGQTGAAGQNKRRNLLRLRLN
jgi:hypothetical protein